MFWKGRKNSISLKDTQKLKPGEKKKKKHMQVKIINLKHKLKGFSQDDNPFFTKISPENLISADLLRVVAKSCCIGHKVWHDAHLNEWATMWYLADASRLKQLFNSNSPLSYDSPISMTSICPYVICLYEMTPLSRL